MPDGNETPATTLGKRKAEEEEEQEKRRKEEEEKQEKRKKEEEEERKMGTTWTWWKANRPVKYGALLFSKDYSHVVVVEYLFPSRSPEFMEQLVRIGVDKYCLDHPFVSRPRKFPFK
jgi:hypothetical protein